MTEPCRLVSIIALRNFSARHVPVQAPEEVQGSWRVKRHMQGEPDGSPAASKQPSQVARNTDEAPAEHAEQPPDLAPETQAITTGQLGAALANVGTFADLYPDTQPAWHAPPVAPAAQAVQKAGFTDVLSEAEHGEPDAAAGGIPSATAEGTDAQAAGVELAAAEQSGGSQAAQGKGEGKAEEGAGARPADPGRMAAARSGKAAAVSTEVAAAEAEASKQRKAQGNSGAWRSKRGQKRHRCTKGSRALAVQLPCRVSAG